MSDRPWKVFRPRIGLSVDIVASYSTEEAARRGAARSDAEFKKAGIPAPPCQVARSPSRTERGEG